MLFKITVTTFAFCALDREKAEAFDRTFNPVCLYFFAKHRNLKQYESLNLYLEKLYSSSFDLEKIRAKILTYLRSSSEYIGGITSSLDIKDKRMIYIVLFACKNCNYQLIIIFYALVRCAPSTGSFSKLKLIYKNSVRQFNLVKQMEIMCSCTCGIRIVAILRQDHLERPNDATLL